MCYNSKPKKPLCYAIYNSYIGYIYLNRGHDPITENLEGRLWTQHCLPDS